MRKGIRDSAAHGQVPQVQQVMNENVYQPHENKSRMVIQEDRPRVHEDRPLLVGDHRFLVDWEAYAWYLDQDCLKRDAEWWQYQ